MWTKPRLSAQPLALLLWTLAWFMDGDGLFAALLPAVLVHELGHFLFLRLGGLRLRSLRLGLFGLEMDYFGCLSGLRGFLAILAGPAFGLAWALLATPLAGDYWRLSSGLSLCLSFVNLLPVLPLDGGRLLLYIMGEKGRGLSRVFALALCVLSLGLLAAFRTLPPLALSLWLLWDNCRLKLPPRVRGTSM